MSDYSVVGIALHSLVEAGKDFGSVIFAFLIASIRLLRHMVEQTGFQQVSHLCPFRNVAIVPAVAY